MYDLVGLVVLNYAKVMLSNTSARINEVKGWPVLIPEGTPDRVIVIDHDRVLDPHLAHRTTNVVDGMFEREFWRVHADQDELLFVLLRPRSDVRKRPEPVDAGIGPEVHEHDSPGKA